MRLPRALIWISNQWASMGGPIHTVHCVSSAIYLHCIRFAYLQLMKQGFNFLLLEINITLLEQMGGSRMGSMKKKQDNGIGSGSEWAEVIKLHNFHTLANFIFDKLGSNVI